MSEETGIDIGKIFRDGESVREKIALEFLEKFRCMYEELDANQKIVFLDMLSSYTKEHLIKLVLSNSQQKPVEVL